MYHCCVGIALFHHHKGFLLPDYKQRNPHINHPGPVSKFKNQWTVPESAVCSSLTMTNDNKYHNIHRSSSDSTNQRLMKKM